MEQLRKAWGWLQRHHFWVLTVVVSLVALACWWSGAQALYREFVDNKGTIKAAFEDQRTLRSQPFHANEDINKRQEAEIATQQQAVHALWKQLYERQTAEVLKWPSSLPKRFHDRAAQLKFSEDIPRVLRDDYLNYVAGHFPTLPRIVGARELAEGEQGGAGAYGSGYGGRGTRGRGGYGEEGYGTRSPEEMAEEEKDYLVEWLDQPRVRGELYAPGTPSSKWIWKTQEDLWVYEALLRIIARTNKAKGADRMSNAAVRVIESLEVGKLAAQASRTRGRIDMVLPPAAAGEMGEGGYGDRGYGGGGYSEEGYGTRGEAGGYGSELDQEGGYPGRGMLGDAATGDANLFDGRYVDDQGQPMVSAGEEGASAYGIEFKRLPVRMQLVMDQRWLPHLIAECANAPLQVEVEEVRVNASDRGGMSGYGGGRGYGESYGPTGGTGGEVMTPESEPNIKPVVIQGIIYIFNPPEQQPDTSQVATN